MILVGSVSVTNGLAELEGRVRTLFSTKASSEYIDAIVRRKNQDSVLESLSALSLLASLLEKAGADSRTLSLSRDEGGRPFFYGSVLDFSISHSRGTVAAALSDSGRVGIDIEAAEIDEKKALRIFHRYFEGDVEPPSPAEFLRLWTEKEAVAKLFGIPLAEALSTETPAHITLSKFEIAGHPCTLAYIGEQEVRILPHGRSI